MYDEDSEYRNHIEICRTGQQRCLRREAVKRIGAEKVAEMGDEDIRRYFEGEGFQSYIEYAGEYDDSDSVLIAKPMDIEQLVKDGKAFWAER